MKVVIDANVFVSAAIQKGASHRIVMAWLEGAGDIDLVMCPELIGEVRDVLATRPRLRKWIGLDDAETYVEMIERTVDLVDDPGEVDATTRDADDDYLIALARLHGAELIVSGDKDLLEWTIQDPPVVTPGDFEELLDQR